MYFLNFVFSHKTTDFLNPTWHKIFFGGLDMGGGAETAPPWKTHFWYFYEFKWLSNSSGT